MSQTPSFPDRLPTTRDLRGRPGALRRLLAFPLLGLLAAAALLLAPALASADSPTTLSVVGTSDVSDSGLMANVIQPAFTAAFPALTFKYTGSATGTAIASAESGAGGPSVLIVHAASLENQFVGNGFSYNNQYGYAIFRNDFVLAGPQADPAGVAANASNNIAQAFADVAAAGISGATPNATFVSRGGTPGTTVAEHQIWALVQSAGLAPTGLLLCTVNATVGGGDTPIAAGNGVTASGQPCPNGGVLPTASQLPAWYAATGATQGPNVVDANACNGFHSGANSCYVFTDRGTFDYLASGTDPAGAIPNLKIVTRAGAGSASAPGGANELVNYFHAYIINPSKTGETVNLTAAQDFVNLLTSPALQAKLQTYLPTADPGGPPFVADASPTISASGLPATYHAGKKVTVKGTVTNNETGYPAVANQTVTIDEAAGPVPVPVPGATAKTSSTGAYSISFVPPTTGSYAVSTGQISQIEDATLSPPFGDILSPAASTSVKVTVRSAVTSLRVKSEAGRAVALGTVAPGTGHSKGSVTLFARKGSKGGFKKIATDRLNSSDANFALSTGLKADKWQFKVKYQDPGQVVGSTSKTVKATVPAKATTSVKLNSAKVNKGTVSVAGKIKPKAAAAGTKVELLALRTSGTSARFAQVAKATVGNGKTKFTLHAKLKRGFRWVLQLEYVQKGQAPSYSSLKTVNVT